MSDAIILTAWAAVWVAATLLARTMGDRDARKAARRRCPGVRFCNR